MNKDNTLINNDDSPSLLIESVDGNLTEAVIEENSITKEKEYFIEGIFLQSEVKNRNNRIYPFQVMKREADKYISEKINAHRGMGELEHPEHDRDNAINLRFVSHKIIALEQRGNDWWGRAKIAHKQGMGALVANLMDCGIVLGTSSRATGSVKRMSDGVSVVQNDFRLITPSDIVADPSAPDAVLTSLLEKTWVWENDILREETAEKITEQVNNKSKIKRLDENDIKNLFSEIMKNIGVK